MHADVPAPYALQANRYRQVHDVLISEEVREQQALLNFRIGALAMTDSASTTASTAAHPLGRAIPEPTTPLIKQITLQRPSRIGATTSTEKQPGKAPATKVCATDELSHQPKTERVCTSSKMEPIQSSRAEPFSIAESDKVVQRSTSGPRAANLTSRTNAVLAKCADAIVSANASVGAASQSARPSPKQVQEARALVSEVRAMWSTMRSEIADSLEIMKQDMARDLQVQLDACMQAAQKPPGANST
jgi:hypothetical protein